MKSHLSLALFLVLSISITAQTDGWHLYTKASEITKIIPDDVNTNELHLATDIGYIKYNTTSGTVTDFLNLTSQNPVIGNVKDIALDPTSNNIALTLKDGIAIYDGLAVTVYSYDNSNLTIGEFTNQFYYLQVEYAKDGSLYIFKEDAFGYQKFNNGVFEPEMTTSFQPQDIAENSAGTKAYFAGVNNGLWELEKSNGTWTNYTMSNSNLTNNFLTSFAVDANEDLYIGHYQGLDKLMPDGTFTNCNATAPIAVFEISLSPVNDDILVRTSAPYLSYNGLSVVDYDSCTWTNYKEDGTNCLDKNVYSSCSYGGNGLSYVAPQIFSPIPDIGSLYEFTVPTESCSEIDINYLNAPVAVNSNVVTDVGIRKKTNGNLEIGFTRTFDFHTVEINPATFDGVFPTATTLTPSPGSQVFSVLNDNNHFIVETDDGWHFINENNDITTFNHNIPDYLAFVTKKAANYDSENGIINIVHKGFDAAFNIRVYKTQCNTATGTCATSEEIFTTNRDLTQNVFFGVSEESSSDNIHTVGISLDTSVSGMSNNNNAQQNSNSLYTEEFWNKNSNGSSIIQTAAFLNIILPNKDPLIIRTNTDKINTIAQLSDNKTLRIYSEGTDGELTSQDFIIDIDNADGPDEIISSSVYDYYGLRVLVLMVKNNSGIQTVFSELYETEFGTPILSGNLVQQVFGFSGQSDNLTINKILAVTETSQTGSRSQNNDTATIATLTNYGLIIKTNVDVSQLTLSDSDAELSETVLTLFPNPSNDIVTFSINQINSASVFDIKGRRVLEVNSSSFSVKGLAKGVYILRAITANGAAISKKLIKN